MRTRRPHDRSRSEAATLCFYAPDAGDELLTVVEASAVAGFSLKNLPVEVEYVADVSDGETIVVIEPMDA